VAIYSGWACSTPELRQYHNDTAAVLTVALPALWTAVYACVAHSSVAIMLVRKPRLSRSAGTDWICRQEMEIGEVEELLQRRGILKDPVLEDKAKAMQKERETREAEMRAAREKEAEAAVA
jgi:hypothetical protein